MGQQNVGSTVWAHATLYLRVALSAAFLTSVADRFGVWGSYGAANVAWGDMTHFITYAATFNPWFPKAVIPAVAWFVTSIETLLAAVLLLGFETRRAAQVSGWLLLAFAVGMTAGTGIKSALNASVFSASAGAFLLASIGTYPWSMDSAKARKQAEATLSNCAKSQLKNKCDVLPSSNTLTKKDMTG